MQKLIEAKDEKIIEFTRTLKDIDGSGKRAQARFGSFLEHLKDVQVFPSADVTSLPGNGKSL